MENSRFVQMYDFRTFHGTAKSKIHLSSMLMCGKEAETQNKR